MSAEAPATRGASERQPPKKTGQTTGGVVTSTTVTTAAAELDVLGAGFAGGAYYSFQAVGADVYIWFKAATSAASITVSNGMKLLDGIGPQDFWLSSDARFLEHIGSSAGTLRWWRSSPNYRV